MTNSTDDEYEQIDQINLNYVKITDAQRFEPQTFEPQSPSLSRDEQHLEAQKERGESSLKWWILLDVFFSWTSAYFLTFCVSSLETTLLDLFNWDSSYFSYIVASTFFGAIIGPFCLPFFDGIKNRMNLCTLLNNQIILLIGQILFALLLDLYHNNQKSAYFILMCISRFIIGIGMGSTDALAQSTINLWFGASANLNEAFGILVIGIELGTLTSRLAFPPFYHYFNTDNDNDAIALPFLLALFLPIISIIISVFVKIKIHKAKRISPEYFVAHHNILDNDRLLLSDSMSTVKQISNLSYRIWLVIFIVVFVNVVINVLYSCFVDPLHESFKFSEYEADMVLSLCALSIIIFAFPAAFIMDYYGGSMYWLLMVSFVMSLSMGLLAFTAIIDNNSNVKHMNMYGIVSIVGFSILLPFSIVIFTLQAMVSPPQYAELIASISTTLWWSLSIIITNVFGWIRDSYGSYSYSLLSMFILCALTFIIAVILFVTDKRINGPLSKCNKRNNYNDSSKALSIN